VVDLGNKKEDKTKKGKKKEGEEQEENFEFLNLSELQDQWNDAEIPEESNQRLLRNLRAYELSLSIIKSKTLKQAENKNSYLKVVERAYIFLIKFVKNNREN
jgi:hypothetical protein